MPVSTTSYKAGTVLEAAVLCDQHGLSYFKRIESTLQDLKGSSQDQPNEQTCSVEMMSKLITTIQEQLPCQRFWQVEIMVLVIKHIAVSTQEGESDNLSVLLDNGLTEMLVFVFEETRRHVSQNGREARPEADHLMEVLFETINDVAEYSGAARKLTVEAFCARLIKLVINIKIVFHTRMEAERTLNLLLEGCEDEDLSWVGEDPVIAKLMQHLAEFLPVAGDFEMQIAITESLARMVTKSERKRRSPAWFPPEAISNAFLAIDDQQFDSDCRTFLNLLNESYPGRSVYSFSCKKAFLGDYELRNPNEGKLSEFWVDFNAVSQSITMYVADEDTGSDEEGGLWETVTFSKEKVKEYLVNEDEKGHMNLVITLTEPPSSILAFCGKDGRTATIIFKPRTDLADALATSIGLEKNGAQVETPSSSRKSSVSKINVLVNRARNTSWGLSNMPQSFNDGYVDGGVNHEAQPGKAARPSGGSHASEAKATPVRRKISIPLVPMTTPTRTFLHSSSSSRVCSVDKTPKSKATNQGFVQPRTPTGHHGSTKKVKTPLQVTVADKPSTSGTDSNLEHPKPQSTTPAKVSVTRNTIICKSPVVQRERDGESPRLVPDSQEGTGADSLGILQKGAVQKKMRKGKSSVTTGEGDRDLEDQSKISSAAKSAKEKKGLQNIDLGKALNKDGKAAQSKRSSREDSSEAVAVAAQDIAEIPDTQSESLISHDSEASQESHQSKGRKKGRKAPTNPPSEGSKRTTRSFRASQAQSADKASGLSGPLQPENKCRRGKRFKLYSDTSLLMDSSESEDMNGRSKMRGKEKKARGGSDKASDTVRETGEYALTTSKGKGVCTKKGKKRDVQEDLQVTEKKHNSDKQADSTQLKPKGASKKSRNDIAPLVIEDNLSQDFAVPKTTAKGKPTQGVNDLKEDKMTTSGLMYNPDPLEEEEHMTSRLPQIDERAAAQALAAENAEYCVPSSAPEEGCASSQGREEIIPDSQPEKNSFRRSGRFPSPLLSDITEESTLSKGSSGPKLGKRLQSPHTSSQSEDASELIVIKSRTKPETAKADSTSVNQDEKDPYDFVDSSTVSSLPVVSRKTPPKDGGGDADSAKAAKKQGGKAAGAKKGKGGSLMTACQDVGVEESSQDEFVNHSHTFGFKNKGNGKSQSRDQGKSQQSAKGLKTSPESDHRQETTEAEDDDLMACEKPRQSSRKKMKGKLDSDDAYIRRIQRETKELAEFASRMQDQEEEYPDIEVGRDVAHVTEAYEDTNISTFVKSVMKSLPKHRKNKDILKNAINGEGKTFDRLDKTQDVEVEEEATHAEKEDLEDAEEHTRHRSGRSSSDSRKRSLKSMSRSRDAEVGDEQEISKPKKKVTSNADASRKEVLKGAEDKSSRKSTRRASRESMKGDESLTEGEISVDDMVSAHMESILGNRSDGMKESASRKADEDRVKERRMVSHMDELEVNEEVLRRAEDSISRRSKMIVALEHSSVDLSDTEQDEKNYTVKVEKIQRKRSVERKVSHTADGASKRAKRSSMSSIPGDQAPCAPATTKVQSPKGHKKRQSKYKQPRLDQSDDEDAYDYERDLEELQASRKKTKQDKSEQQKDSIIKKSKTITPKTTFDDTPTKSAKNRRSMKDSVDLEEARSGGVKPKAVINTHDETERSAVKSKVSKDGRRHFGSQIEESDSEEIMETATTTTPDDTSTVVSVECFSNMCKDLLKSSGKGIAAGRKRRNLQTVDYRESENSYSESDDLLDLQTPGRSTTKTTCEKPTRDIYEYREETSSCCTASFIEDAISEHSWLVDRPKQKVSTYSKTRREVFGLAKITQNLDTVKKPRHKPQVKNANAPKKRKSQSSKEEEEEELPLYYYAEEEQEVKKAKKQTKRGTQGREHDDVPLSKKPKSSCRRSLVECMSSMSSSINHMYDSSQDVRDEDDEGEENDGREEEEEEGRIPATPALTIETMTSQMSTWSTPGSVTRTPRTPKQVSFVDELESLGSEGGGDFEMECPVSGPSKSVRPSESTLKRKYANLLLDDDDEGNDEDVNLGEEEQEEEEEEEEDALLDQGDGQRSKEKQRGLNLSLGQTSFLEPKVLFKANEPKGELEQSEHSGEDGISDHSISSSWGHNMDFPAMQMPEMFGFMRNRLKQKMMEKRNQTQQLTESAIQSTQKQMNKLFLELHKARQRSQNEFQDKLLTELVGMEGSLEKLAKIQAQNEHILKQYAKKSTQHVEQHLSRVEELHAGFMEKGARLGENVVESLQHIVNKEMKNMLKKMMQDMQQEQMKKTMQSLFLLR